MRSIADVMGAEVVRRGKGWVYRFADMQLNGHGPGLHSDPGGARAALPQPGNSDLCFEWQGPIADAKGASRGAPASPSSWGPSSGTPRAAPDASARLPRSRRLAAGVRSRTRDNSAPASEP